MLIDIKKLLNSLYNVMLIHLTIYCCFVTVCENIVKHMRADSTPINETNSFTNNK